jgi:hypothetical protein
VGAAAQPSLTLTWAAELWLGQPWDMGWMLLLVDLGKFQNNLFFWIWGRLNVGATQCTNLRFYRWGLALSHPTPT